MHIYLAKSTRFESTDFAPVMIDDVGCSRRHQCPQCEKWRDELNCRLCGTNLLPIRVSDVLQSSLFSLYGVDAYLVNNSWTGWS